MAELNVELLDRTLAHIEAHPETWKQELWRCETGMCFAGTACDLAGGTWAAPADEAWARSFLLAEPEDDPDFVVAIGGKRVVGASVRAERLLGLPDNADSDDWLFDASNTLDDLRRIVADLKAAAS